MGMRELENLERRIREIEEEEMMSSVQAMLGTGGPFSPSPYATPQSLPGVFGDLVTRVWRVTGLAVHEGPNGGERFTATVVNAVTDANDPHYFPNYRTFEVTEEEYEALNIGSLIHVTLNFE